ncbi:ATP-binding protein [Rhodococcus ruber]|uniref:sensor histidine kinase n=2 Tax=Nocardiaceae TaxID=85025 RepID=UPI000C14D967|nr:MULTISPECIES: ATP-binding protein [Rhodococcus]ATQ29062.1 ATPase [Rhodococcus ruber]MCZ1074163.1 ATP-binding protein [Rhodococcus sp. A5(2022)]
MSDRDAAVGDYSGDTVRWVAMLRLPLIALMALVGPVIVVAHWLPVLFLTVLTGYALAALGWLVLVLRGPVRHSWWAPTLVDIVALLGLCAASGGATSVLLPVFFLLPVTVTFLHRPWWTAAVGVATATGFLLVWLFYAVRDDGVDLPAVVYLYFGFMVWLAAAMTGLSVVLAHRADAVAALLATRRRLVTEALDAESRERQLLAEQLHDGPLQNVLAARLDVEEAGERRPDDALLAADTALREAARQLRSTVTTLHPQVLSQLGLATALRELAEQSARRGGFAVDVVVDGSFPREEALLFSVARELLGNVVKHAKATSVRVRLVRRGPDMVLEVADDGCGFDPATLPDRVGQGHIGLASHVLRVESVGGTAVVRSAPGDGTTVTVTVPATEPDGAALRPGRAR